VAAKEAGVGAGILFGENLDVAEMRGEAGLGEFALLIAQVALGDDEEAVRTGERGEGFGDAFEQLDRMSEHVATEGEERADFLGADFAVGEGDGGFDGGESEAFHAIAVELEVAHLGGEERAIDGGSVVIVREQLAVTDVDVFKDGLVVPERVVGVETDGADVLHGGS